MNDKIRPLSALVPGESATVASVDLELPLAKRLLDMGLIEGTKVFCVLSNPYGDPKAYLIRGAVIALRNEDSSFVYVKEEPWD